MVQPELDTTQPLTAGQRGKGVAEFMDNSGQESEILPGRSGHGKHDRHCNDDEELREWDDGNGGLGESGKYPLP
jgi:hypothetical protein